MSRRPIRWRIAELFEGPNGGKAVLAIGALAFAAFIMPLVFKGYQANPADPVIGRPAEDCASAWTEFSRTIPDGASRQDPARLCVEKARTKIVVASVATFFIIFFTIIALMARAGKIQPKEVAR